MDVNQQRNHDARPDPPRVADDVRQQLAESLQLRQEAENKAIRADRSASEMARVLRRIAEAMDRNPNSWDELFEGDGTRR